MKLNKDIFSVGDIIKLYRYDTDGDTIISRACIHKFIVSSIELTQSTKIKLNTIEGIKLFIYEGVNCIYLCNRNFILDRHYMVDVARMSLKSVKNKCDSYYIIDLNGRELTYNDYIGDQ